MSERVEPLGGRVFTGKCAWCRGRVVYPGDQRVKVKLYCCRGCKEKARAARRRQEAATPRRGVCVVCGESFKVAARGRVAESCSAACRAERQRQRALERRSCSPRECLDCGGPLPPGARTRCEACRGPQPKPCVVCGGMAPSTHKTCRPECREARRVAMSRIRRLRAYGLTPEEWDALWVAQGERCAVCGATEPDDKAWHTDHDHATGAVRGILCRACNHALGAVRDSPAVLRALADYLER